MKHIFLIVSLIYTTSFVQAQCSNPYAGPDDNTCGVAYQLHAENTTTGTWTAFHNATPLVVTFVGTAHASDPVAWVLIPFYSGLFFDVDFVWTDNSGPCADTVRIRFAREPIAGAGPSDYVETCGNTYTFSADTVGMGWAYGTWISQGMSSFDNVHDPNATVTINPYGCFGDSASKQAQFLWVLNNFGCTSIDTINVHFYQVPTAYAGYNYTICGLEGNLHAFYSLEESSNYSPSGNWSVFSGPNLDVSFYAQNSNQTIVTVSEQGTYEFIWTETNTNNPECLSKDTVSIQFLQIPVVDAGPDFNVCGNTTTLHATGTGYQGSWFNTPGANFESQTTPVTIVTSQYGPKMFFWQEANGICYDRDTVIVTFYPHPSAEILSTPADFDTLACGLVYSQLMAEPASLGQSGHWVDTSNPFTMFNASSQPDFDTVTVTQYGYHDFYWIVENLVFEEEPGFCADTAGPFTVYFLEIPVAHAGNDTMFCSLIGHLNAEPSEFSGTWLYNCNGIIIEEDHNPVSPIITPQYSQECQFIWFLENESCNSSDTVVIKLVNHEIVQACNNQVVSSCTPAYLNLGTGETEYSILWEPEAGLNDATIENPTALPLVSTMYYVTITELLTGCTDIDSVLVTVIPDDTISLCMVTVNSENKNLVIWEKPISDIIDSFQVFRESDGIYNLIGLSPYNALGEFTDVTSQPELQSYRYKISALYNCGQETDMSDAHKTVWLNWEILSPSVWHLQIEPYEGIEYAAIQIFRGIDPENLQWLTTLPADATEYTDNDVPTGSYVYYQAKIDLTTPCNFAKSGNSILSNIATNDPGFYVVSPVEFTQFTLSPNPARNSVSVSFDSPNAKLSICDLSGKALVVKNDFTGGGINIENLKTGVYVVKLETESGIAIRKLIVD
ncbi:MAG: T9SS type A sorting domain-containing protein [Bacteroidales bacterium]|nr:T9SS type A sorting domain-containing protein [Bacteroidales bacterium]